MPSEKRDVTALKLSHDPATYDRLNPYIDTQFESPDCGCVGMYPCPHMRAPLVYLSTPYYGYGVVTMDMADRLDQAGLWGIANIARKYAVDRPRWWHRFTRSR